MFNSAWSTIFTFFPQVEFILKILYTRCMTDLEKAKEIFYQENCTFVLVKGDDIIKSTEHALTPLVKLAEGEKDFTDYSICDRIAGRAASFLYVLLGLKEVYAVKMAKLAVQILDRAEIKFETDEYIETILDANMKDIDKSEQAVVKSGSAVKALEDLKAALL